MLQCIVIDAPPISFDKGRNEQEESGLRLVEIRYHRPHNVVFIARSNHYLRAGVKRRQVVTLQIVENVCKACKVVSGSAVCAAYS